MKKLISALILTMMSSITLAAQPVATMETNLGNIEIELAQDKAPVTVKNFIEYAQSGFYTNTVFHRVIAGFMAQGGGYDTKLQKKSTKAPIVNESSNGLKNDRATIAMARTSNPNSATSQFFINFRDNDSLNFGGPYGGYAVFGKVIKGMDVVDKMATIRTGPGGQFRSDVPTQPIIIKKVTISQPEQAKPVAESGETK